LLVTVAVKDSDGTVEPVGNDPLIVFPLIKCRADLRAHHAGEGLRGEKDCGGGGKCDRSVHGLEAFH